jgi:hypothetical protein
MLEVKRIPGCRCMERNNLIFNITRHGFGIRVFKLCNEIEEMGKKLWLGVVLVQELWKASCASQERVEKVGKKPTIIMRRSGEGGKRAPFLSQCGNF